MYRDEKTMLKKRYCIFSAQYLPHMGGVERYTYNLAKELINQGNEVVVVTSNLYCLEKKCFDENIEIYRLPCFNLLSGRYPVIKFDKEFKELNRDLKKKKIDMVIVNTRFYIHSLYGMIFAMKRKIPCITIEHGTSHLSVHNKFLDVVGAVFEHTITWIEKKICKNYYGVSKACNDWLKHFHIHAKGVIYNSINVDEIENIYENAGTYFRNLYCIPDEAIIITFTGRLLKEKGLPSLLNVVEYILIERKDIYLFIAGDGNMKKEIAQRKNEHIIPLGQLEFEQIVTLLKESDIFCLPSFSEGFSTSILEAVACRCYILTTARGGARELIVNKEYGSIIMDNSEDVLLSELLDVINDVERRQKAVPLAYKRLKENFTWKIAAKEIEGIFIELNEERQTNEEK
ncbi:glycosyltransferase family 4 protein [Bariatricus sp. SGI.019]|uniref:glycosyltransferase family 4 protein n=1 Tax=Bariatricus sp. SGI.019 TaxID=3420548 RepID=UPI003CFD7EB2